MLSRWAKIQAGLISSTRDSDRQIERGGERERELKAATELKVN